MRFVPLPPPTTAEVEALAATIARRLTERLVAAPEAEGNDYLDPNLASLCDALFWSRNAPAGTRDLPALPGMENTGRDEDGLRGKPLCASVAGFSLHAAQFVSASDREGLERSDAPDSAIDRLLLRPPLLPPESPHDPPRPADR